MKNDSYLVVEESALPEVYQKVVKANALLESGEASTASEAVRKAGISRSVYYKYRDAVFPYTQKPPRASSPCRSSSRTGPGCLSACSRCFTRRGQTSSR